MIDIFFKIRYLAEAGYSVFLHAFEYDRKPAEELKLYCKSVFYYKRKTGIRSFFSILPYIVYSRRSKELLKNLTTDDCPVLFEGLHTCYYLDHPALADRLKIVRTHNIEHIYYRNLARISRDFSLKFFFLSESLKLKRFEKKLKYAGQILSISVPETVYFSNKYGKVEWLGAFHGNTGVSSLPGRGKFILLHGNLSITENERAVLWAVKEVLRSIDFPIVIAGKNPSSRLVKTISRYPGITLIDSPDEDAMNQLIAEAHINFLISYYPSGLKLKLIHSLFRGRFVVANPPVVQDSGLEETVAVGKNNQQLNLLIRELLTKEFDVSMIEKRKEILKKYTNRANISKLVMILEK